MKNFLKRFALLVGILIIGTICFAQKKNIIGINVTGEKTSISEFAVGIGGTFEKQIRRHQGIETGLYYRPFVLHGQVYINGAVYGDFFIRETYLSIPVLYKFYSSILNFSLGPTFDIYAGWKETKSTLSFPAHYPDPTSKFHFGLLGKVSKSIPLTKRMLLEPEIRYNTVFYKKRNYYYHGAGLSVKYVLAK